MTGNEIGSGTGEDLVITRAPAGERVDLPEASVRLWPHQDQAATATVKLLAEHPRAHLVSACGTGKTLACAEIARRCGAERRLIAVPTLELAGQLLGEWRRLLGARALGSVTGVCSSEEVVRFHGDLDAEITTSPDELAARAGDGACTVVSTYMSLPIVATAHSRGLAPFDIAVADEAHRTVGPQAGRWTRIHDAGQILADKRVYATATPRISGIGGDGAVSMDDETVFGPRSFTLGFGEAIRRRLLAEYRVAASVVSDQRIHDLILAGQLRDDRLQVGDWVIPIATVAAQIALLRAASRWDLRSLITFHANRADAALFASSLTEVARLLPEGEQADRPIRATYVHGGQDPRERARRIDRLRTPGEALNVVSNVRVLTEGVDIPAVDGVMFAHPTRSVVRAAQAVGRALRLGGRPDKIATIIVPMLLTEPATGVDLADEGWDALGQVAAALAAHDERLAAEFGEARRRIGEHQFHDLGSDADLQREPSARPPGWLALIGDPPPPGFSEAVAIHAIRAATGSWEELYGAARAFHAVHGHLLVPASLVAGGLKLGSWIRTQRGRRHTMPRWQRDLLDEIGMVWNAHEATWEEYFQLAVQFKREHGHLRMPHGYSPGGKKAGAWLGRQERAYTDGRLRDDRARRLIELGMDPGWTEREYEALRSARLNQLRGWLDTNPGCRKIPAHLNVDGIDVGKWWRKELARLDAGTLTPGQATTVHQLIDRYELNIQKPPPWDQAYDLLAGWLEQTQETIVPTNLILRTDDGAIDVDQWFRDQITRMDNGALTPEQQARLHALVPGTDPRDLVPSNLPRLTWEQTCLLLETWMSRTGSLVVPKNLRISGTNIYAWIRHQLRSLEYGDLTAEQEQRLSRLRPDGDIHQLPAPHVLASEIPAERTAT